LKEEEERDGEEENTFEKWIRYHCTLYLMNDENGTNPPLEKSWEEEEDPLQ
jgi:hypothetical protein